MKNLKYLSKVFIRPKQLNKLKKSFQQKFIEQIAQ